MAEEIKTESQSVQSPITSEIEQIRQQRQTLQSEINSLEIEMAKAQRLRSELLMSGKSQMQPREELTDEQKKKQALEEYWKGTEIGRMLKNVK